MKALVLIAALVIPSAVFASDELSGGEELYKKHCQDCHGVDRLGAMGPALFPENLSRLRKNKAAKVIANGRIATQMPSFKATLSPQQVAMGSST